MADPISSRYAGIRINRPNNRVEIWEGNGGASDPVEVARFDATNGQSVRVGGLTVVTGGLTVTAGGATVTAGDCAITAGNIRMGPINSFGTTEPTQTAVFEAGTAPAGAITTSSAVFASSTVLRKIIADGTVSNVG
jgi:ethanolamine utilization microcompartment shell protein EutS